MLCVEVQTWPHALRRSGEARKTFGANLLELAVGGRNADLPTLVHAQVLARTAGQLVAQVQLAVLLEGLDGQHLPVERHLRAGGTTIIAACCASRARYLQAFMRHDTKIVQNECQAGCCCWHCNPEVWQLKNALSVPPDVGVICNCWSMLSKPKQTLDVVSFVLNHSCLMKHAP